MAKTGEIQSAGRGKDVQQRGGAGGMLADDDFWGAMERLMDRFGSPAWPRFREPLVMRAFADMPRVDIIDGDNEIKLRAALPGVDRNDLNVEVTEDEVLIKGSTRSEEKEEEENYVRCELVHGEFSRNVALPSPVDASRAKATFREGVLELVMPKTTTRQRQSIAIE